MKLLQAVRFDPSDTFTFPKAAEPGEWVVPGGFFFREEPEGGSARQAFANGWLSPASRGHSTFAAVARSEAQDVEGFTAALEALVAELGAPDPAAVAHDELAFVRDLADAPVGTVLALRRFVEDGALRETFHRVETDGAPHARVWEIVE